MSQIDLLPLGQSSLDLWKPELINGVRAYQATSTETSLCLPQLPAPLPHTCYTPVSIPASVLTCGWLLGFSQALPGPHDAVPRARIAASGYTVYGGKFDKCLFD